MHAGCMLGIALGKAFNLAEERGSTVPDTLRYQKRPKGVLKGLAQRDVT